MKMLKRIWRVMFPSHPLPCSHKWKRDGELYVKCDKCGELAVYIGGQTPTNRTMKIQIKSVAGSVLFEGYFSCIAEAVKSAIKSSVDLRYADLSYADLSSADLSSADLSSADLSSGKIKATPRPFIQISPLGKEAWQLMAFDTDKGICLITGCFIGGVKEFKEELKNKHGSNHIAKEYLLAVNLIENHFQLWK